MLNLDLGCGPVRPEGFVGIDCRLPADILHDLRQGLPILDDAVAVLRARDCLEHLPDTVSILNDCWRVLRPGGGFIIEVPRWPHVDAIKDPTHIRFFAVETFTEYLCGPSRLGKEYGMRMWDIVSLQHDEKRIWVTLTPRGKHAV